VRAVHTALTTAPALKNPQLDFAAASCANCHSQAKELQSIPNTLRSVSMSRAPRQRTASAAIRTAEWRQPSAIPPSLRPRRTSTPWARRPCTYPEPSAVRAVTIAATSLDYVPIDCTTCHSQPAMAPLRCRRGRFDVHHRNGDFRALLEVPRRVASPDRGGDDFSGPCPAGSRCTRPST